MKKLLAILLAVMMLLSLTACGKSGSDEPTIVGSWKGSMDLSAIMAAIYQIEIEDPIPFGMTFTFNADNTYSVAVDEESIDAFMDAVVDMVVGMMSSMYGEEFDLETMLAEEGMTMDEFTEEIMASVNMDSILSSIASQKAYYKYEDGKIYAAEDKDDLEGDLEGDLEDLECTYVTLKGKTMTITDIEQDGEKMSEVLPDMFPMVFTRQK